MSIIDTCGGYDKAKIYVDQFKELSLDAAAELFEAELLEYRREHGIFEVGDKVVFINNRYSARVCIWAHKTNWRPSYALLDRGNGYLEPFSNSDIRHATDAEIEAGKRDGEGR